MKIFQIKGLALLLLLALIMATVSCEQAEVLPNPESIDHIEERAACVAPPASAFTSDDYGSVIHVYMYPYASEYKQMIYRPDAPLTVWSDPVYVRAGKHYHTIYRGAVSSCTLYKVRFRYKCGDGTWSNWSATTTVGGHPYTCY